jgi:adenosylhomocysteine nucleosidase
MTRPYVVVVTGLLAEARVAHLRLDRTIAGGGDPIRLESELARALSDDADAVLSFGLAAGLEPGRRPGTLVVPGEVVSGTERYATDVRWSERMRVIVGGADSGPIAGVDAPLIRPIDKAQLYKSTRAVAADMESHLAARLAQRAGRPFAALRVISDPAERSLPPAAAIGMKPDGSVNAAAVLLSLLRHPGQLAELARVATEARTAMRVLSRCRRVLGPDLGWAKSAAA